MNSIPNFRQGFTLIEIIIVVALIGIISVVFFVNLSVIPKARDAQRKADLRQLEKAVEQYRSDNGIYPRGSGITSLANCPPAAPAYFGDDISSNPCSTTYLNKIPKDPDPLNNNNYFYYSEDGSKYFLVACLENDKDKDGSILAWFAGNKIRSVFGDNGMNAVLWYDVDPEGCDTSYGFFIIGQ